MPYPRLRLSKGVEGLGASISANVETDTDSVSSSSSSSSSSSDSSDIDSFQDSSSFQSPFSPSPAASPTRGDNTDSGSEASWNSHVSRNSLRVPSSPSSPSENSSDNDGNETTNNSAARSPFRLSNHIYLIDTDSEQSNHSDNDNDSNISHVNSDSNHTPSPRLSPREDILDNAVFFGDNLPDASLSPEPFHSLRFSPTPGSSPLPEGLRRRRRPATPSSDSDISVRSITSPSPSALSEHSGVSLESDRSYYHSDRDSVGPIMTNSSRNAAASLAAATGGANGSNGTSVSFECSVCLENLDLPASIDIPQNEVNVPNENLPGSSSSAGGPGRGRGGRSSRGRSQASPPTPVVRPNAAPARSLTDVVATYCGHLYHEICLTKWFEEQGRRSCPSCRKLVPKTKLIRLFPSSSSNLNAGIPNQMPDSVPATVPTNEEGGPNVQDVNDAGDCMKAECQDLRDIHNTLINDFNDLQQRYDDLREGDEIKQAQICSLEEDNTKKENEIALLKRQLRENQDGNSGPLAVKRKRH